MLNRTLSNFLGDSSPRRGLPPSASESDACCRSALTSALKLEPPCRRGLIRSLTSLPRLHYVASQCHREMMRSEEHLAERTGMAAAAV